MAAHLSSLHVVTSQLRDGFRHKVAPPVMQVLRTFTAQQQNQTRNQISNTGAHTEQRQLTESNVSFSREKKNTHTPLPPKGLTRGRRFALYKVAERPVEV